MASPKPSAVNPHASRFRAAHASFRLRMLQEQHAPAVEQPVLFEVLNILNLYKNFF